MADKKTAFNWKFQRLGGLDQVVLGDAEDIRHLPELDPKLWVALSCPASGLEFDAKTLFLLDTDKDGRIRISEVKDAINWTCANLKDLSGLLDDNDFLPLSVINDETEEGAHLLATAKAVLKNLGKEDAEGLTQEDITTAAANAAANPLNGDGVLPPLPVFDADVQGFIKSGIEVMGGIADAGGETGIDKEIAAAFVTSMRNWQDWRENVDEASTPMGKNTSEAWDLLQKLESKVDDYFLRSELASYAPQAQAALNVDEKLLVPVDHGLLENEPLAELPLSKIEPDQPLRLKKGLNPAWRKDVERFASIIESRLASTDQMTREEWQAIKKDLAPYAEALAKKPGIESVKTNVKPVSTLDALGEEKVQAILDSKVLEKFNELADEDLATPAAASDIAEVEKLVLYHRHLYKLLLNFASFRDFYATDSHAAFQTGTLYIDGRSCRLCVPVQDVAKHSTLASFTQLYLLYCKCVSQKDDGSGTEEQNIVAAVTAGSADLLLENRNGVFVDHRGRNWDATVVKIISNPISIQQAVWDPYKRFGRMLTEQINKLASSKDAALVSSSTKKLEDISAQPAAAAQQAPAKFDIGRNVGIFAAVGLAIGAIGTAVASIASALFSLHWWQFPLLFLGIFLLVSGPSVVMAWLKLRQRTVGPLLEASGWAVNGRVAINYMLGRQLTTTAALPSNAKRSYVDPLGQKRRWPWVVLVISALVGVAAWLWFTNRVPAIVNYVKGGKPAAVKKEAPPKQEKPAEPAVPAAPAEPADKAPAPAE